MDTAAKLDFKFKLSKRIGVVHGMGAKNPQTEDWVGGVSPMLAGVHCESGLSDNLVSVFGFTKNDADQVFSKKNIPSILKRKHIDGLILTGTHCDPVIELAEDMAMPCALMNVRDADKRPNDTIAFDELFTGMLATEHLIEHGHRRILHVSVQWPGDHYSVAARRLGYEMAMRQAGLDPFVHIREGDIDSYEAWLHAVCAGDDRPTAIFAYNDVIAMSTFRILHELRLSYADVSLITVGWREEAVLLRAGMTWVGLPAMEMGREAMRMLNRKLVGGGATPSMSLRGSIERTGLSVKPHEQ